MINLRASINSCLYSDTDTSASIPVFTEMILDDMFRGQHGQLIRNHRSDNGYQSQEDPSKDRRSHASIDGDNY